MNPRFFNLVIFCLNSVVFGNFSFSSISNIIFCLDKSILYLSFKNFMILKKFSFSISFTSTFNEISQFIFHSLISLKTFSIIL
ncbi:MAG: hypothetical protein Q8S84_09195 [bacterium]|nr:hypothetical protein [bacterium]